MKKRNLIIKNKKQDCKNGQVSLKEILIRMFEINAAGIKGNCKYNNFGPVARLAEAKCTAECCISEGDPELYHMLEMLKVLVLNCNDSGAKNALDYMIKKLKSESSKVAVKSVFTLINTNWNHIGHLTYTMRVLMDLCKIGDFDNSEEAHHELENLCNQIAFNY